MESLAGKFKNKQEAKQVLLSDSFVPATALVISADMLTEGSCFVWEIETLLEELDDLGCLPDEKARDRLLAAISLLKNPKFLWDAQAFMTVAQSINGSLAVPEIWEPLSPAKVVFAVDELNSLYSYYKNVDNITTLYAEEPKIYIAGCCANSGLAELPSKLKGLCSAQFDRMFDIKVDLANELSNPVQARMHQEVEAYVSLMTKIRNKLLSKLK